MIGLNWDELKGFADNRGLANYIQYVETEKRYHVYLFDGQLELKTIVRKEDPVVGGSDQEDFEDNYKATANRTLESRTSEGYKLTHPQKSYHDASASYTTSDFSNKSTWQQQATAVTSEALTTSDQLTYSSVNTAGS